MTDRDTHFQGFAKLSYPELERFFADLFWCRMEGNYEKARITEMLIKDLIAQHAYDLAVHIVEKLDASPLVTLDDRIGYHEKFVNEVPDLTEWQ